MNITLCIGRPTIDKAASGEPVDMGHGVVILAADGLFHNSPYDQIDRLSERIKLLEHGFPVIKVLGHVVNHMEHKDGAIILKISPET